MLFWKKQSKPQETTESVSIDRENIPQHIAVIMDGNGRWAKKRNLPRIAGHKEGMSTVKRIAIAADELGVKAMTLYAFSETTWRFLWYVYAGTSRKKYENPTDWIY